MRRYAPLLAAIVVAAVCVRLGVWQLARLSERRANNAFIAAHLTQPDVRVTDPATVTDSLAWRHIVCAGRWDNSRALVLRGRSMGGVPGVEIVQALHVEGSRSAILVNRGFLVSPNAERASLAEVRDTSLTGVRGVGQSVSAGTGRRDPLREISRDPYVVSAREVSAAAIARVFPYDVAPVLVRQLPPEGAPAWPRPRPAPGLTDGPHVSYAIQWFALATVALIAGTLVTARSHRVA